MQYDTIIQVDNSLMQHGPSNDRVYLMKLGTGDLPAIVDLMEGLAEEHGYSKLFAKVPADAVDFFEESDFMCEAEIPLMVKGKRAGCFMSKYPDPSRAVPKRNKLLDEVRKVAKAKAFAPAKETDTSEVARLGPEHAGELAGLYSSVFKTYPFPIDDPDYLLESMDSDVAFYGIVSNGRLVAASSAEIDMKWKCAEMTDFATLPECRGKGAAGKLLARMEVDMDRLGIVTAYTIARAMSHGMNSVFARAGYELAGLLPNNTQIAGQLESMNVWYKSIQTG